MSSPLAMESQTHLRFCRRRPSVKGVTEATSHGLEYRDRPSPTTKTTFVRGDRRDPKVLVSPMLFARWFRRGGGWAVAEITRQRQGEMLRALFEVLHDAPEGLQASTALKLTEGRLVLTPFELADYPKRPGVRRFE